MATKLEFLVRDYANFRYDLSPKKLAEAEAALWEHVDPVERKQYTKISRWLVAKFGGSLFEYGERHYLYRADRTNGGVDPLWRRLADKRITLAKAVAMHREAKKMAATERISVMSALAIVISEYEKLPIKKVVGGVPIRGAKKPVAIPKRKPKTLDPKAFYARLRTEIEQYAARHLTDVAPDVAEQLLLILETDVSQILDDWSVRVTRARRTAERRSKADDAVAAVQHTISRRKFTEACRTLNIAVPPPGHVDLITAKRAKRKLVRVYHPDLTGGDESTRAAYEAVVEAYQIIEEYAELISR